MYTLPETVVSWLPWEGFKPMTLAFCRRCSYQLSNWLGQITHRNQGQVSKASQHVCTCTSQQTCTFQHLHTCTCMYMYIHLCWLQTMFKRQRNTHTCTCTLEKKRCTPCQILHSKHAFKLNPPPKFSELGIRCPAPVCMLCVVCINCLVYWDEVTGFLSFLCITTWLVCYITRFPCTCTLFIEDVCKSNLYV